MLGQVLCLSRMLVRAFSIWEGIGLVPVKFPGWNTLPDYGMIERTDRRAAYP